MTDELPHATITEDDGIITVTTDRQGKLNAISPQVTEAYWEAVTRLEDRDDLRCMVITAKGKYFTAGLDLSGPGGNRPGNPETEHLHPGWNFRRNYRSHHLLYDEFEAVEKPIVLAVNGICLGAGVEMGGSCDFRFCMPEAAVRRARGAARRDRRQRRHEPARADRRARVGEVHGHGRHARRAPSARSPSAWCRTSSPPRRSWTTCTRSAGR